MRIGDKGGWVTLEKVNAVDPYYAEVREREGALEPLPGRELNKPVPSAHLWKASIPKDLPPGSHLIEVEARDMYGKVYRDRRVIRVQSGDGAE